MHAFDQRLFRLRGPIQLHLRRTPSALACVLLTAALLTACSNGSPSTPQSPTPAPPQTTATPEAPQPQIALEPAFGGRTFELPLEIGAYPGNRLFVAEQTGLVKLLPPDGTEMTVLLDVKDRVDADLGEGLLSLALDPNFETNGHVWTYYFTAGRSYTVLARYTVTNDVADTASELIVLELEQPGYNQNGGAIRFGPDNMLYLSLGDGSASLDPFLNGQNLGTLLGSVIRIDVRESSPERSYVVPPDNPFLDTADARPEIWAYGLRNPWRMAFDPESGDLFAGDVGFSDFEEVNRIEPGANYGWNIREGNECLAAGQDCRSDGLTPPISGYTHDEGRCSITGGLVYRGTALPDLHGMYIFGDFCTGEVFAIDPGSPAEPALIAEGAGQITSFGLDAGGEVYLTSYDGTVWKLVAP